MLSLLLQFLIFLLQSDAKALESVPVYYPSTLSAPERAKRLNDELNKLGMEAVVFGQYQDFIEEVKRKHPRIILAPSSFDKYYLEYRPALGLVNQGGSREFRYVLLALSKEWSLPKLAKARLGMVEQTGRQNLKDFALNITKTKFEVIKSVPKLEDLFPLLVFNSVDVILMTPEDYNTRWKNSRRVVKIAETNPSGYPEFYVRQTDEGEKISEQLNKLNGAHFTQLGFNGVVPLGTKNIPKPIDSEKQTTSAPWQGRPKVLILHNDFDDFNEVAAEIRKELEPNCTLVEIKGGSNEPYESFKEKITAHNPELVILMDNQLVDFAKRYNQEQKIPSKKVRGIALMGLNLKTVLKGNTEIAGIAYEAPGYTLITQFQRILSKPVKKVLLFYRKDFSEDMVRTTAAQLEVDGISLIPISVDAKGADKKTIEKNLEAQLKEHTKSTEKYDAVWVQLDSILLNQELFTSTWLPLARTAKLPFLAGIENLVRKNFNFAVFGIAPDLRGLANQAIQMAEALLSRKATPKQIGVEDLVSIRKILNISKSQELGLPLSENNLSDVKIED